MPAIAHAPVDTKTNVDGALALIEKVKAMLMKMIHDGSRGGEESIAIVTKFGCPSLPHHPPFHPHVRPSSRGGALPGWDEGNMHQSSMAGWWGRCS
jgi:hypothetical protein